MGRRLRIQDPDVFYFITNTCHAREFLFVPGPEMNAIFEKRLRNSVELFGVELIAAVCMANHFHLIVRAPKMNLHLFMGHFQGLLARDVNKLRDREESSVFPRRYSSEPILDDAALLEKMAYVVMNPVNAGVVDHPAQYPGYTSWATHQNGNDESAPEITAPPVWSDLNSSELADSWNNLIQPHLAALGGDSTRWVMGAERATQIEHWSSPKLQRKTRRTRKPRAHASSIRTWKAYVQAEDDATKRYRECAEDFRSGSSPSFPYGTIPPGMTACSCDSTRVVPPIMRIGRRPLPKNRAA